MPEEARHSERELSALRASFRRVERREWWLWAAAIIITLAISFGLASFLVVGGVGVFGPEFSDRGFEIIRGLVALIFLFDLYTVFQQAQIHRIRKQLLYREELFHLISENAADMFAIVNMKGQRIFNSLSYEKVVGYTQDELCTTPALEQVHPEDRPSVQAAAEEARRTGIGKRLEYRFRHKDGSWLTLESIARVTRDAKGEPDKLIIVNRDVTQRKAAEEAMRRSQADFRSIIDHAPYGIYRATLHGRFLQVNPALQKMLHYDSSEELLQCDLARDIFRNTSDYADLLTLLHQVSEVKDRELEWKCKDGAFITVRCSSRLLHSQNGELSHVEVFADDISERKVLESQLRMGQKMEAIGRLSGGIAHDFNNLLGVILGFSRLLKKALRGDPLLSEHVMEIEKAGDRAVSLTRQLLAFSRQQLLKPVVIDLNALLLDMQEMLPRLLGEDINVELHLQEDLGRLKADQSQIEQVVMNLAINARDAMPGGGTLEISTCNASLSENYARTHVGSTPGEYVSLIVRDTGIGMNAHTLAHIFEPFFTTKEVGKGTGLGLSTVYGVVKQSNGYISVESAPGEGATFQIYLPLFEGTPEPLRRPASSQEIIRGSESILLVEDSDALRRFTETVLLSAGFQVVAVSNGTLAIDAVESAGRSFDLLLTDVVMPQLNGPALACHLLARIPGLKVLYMSGYADAATARNNGQDVQSHLLQKPFSEETLLRSVREAIDTKPPTDSHAGPDAQKPSAVLQST